MGAAPPQVRHCFLPTLTDVIQPFPSSFPKIPSPTAVVYLPVFVPVLVTGAASKFLTILHECGYLEDGTGVEFIGQTWDSRFLEFIPGLHLPICVNSREII